MEKYGHIYLLTNKINGQKYVGQTARDIWTRFEEHCANTHNSYIGNAIQKYGYLNFSVEEIEKVPLDQLDEREKHWITHYDTYHNGYNRTLGGKVPNSNTYNHVLIVERNLIVDSIERFGELAHQQVGWTSASLIRKIRQICDTDKDFLTYHFKAVSNDTELSPEDEVLDWIQTLQIRFTGKHIYCFELDQEFDTIAACARYLLDNNLYITKSKTPIQSVVTAIGKQLHGAIQYITGVNQNYTFCFLPGSTKQAGTFTPFQAQKVYCPQLDKEFNSSTEAATYFIENKIWSGIKIKTARLRISDILNQNFPEYRGYTFERR